MRATTSITVQVPASEYFRECGVTYRGVPVGRVRLARNELAIGELQVERGYLAIRELIRRASESLWAVGFLSLGWSPAPSQVPLEVVTQAADLELELRDETGALIWTDFVNIIERPDPADPPVVFARLRLAAAPQGAVVGPRAGGSVAGS